MNDELLVHHWRSYRGNIVPHAVMEGLLAQHKQLCGDKIKSRLSVGDKVRVLLEDPLEGKDQWLSALVFDVTVSYGEGVRYALAFSVGVSGFWVISQDYPAVKLAVTGHEEESANTSGIFTEEEFQQYMEARLKPAPQPQPKATLSIVK